MRKFIILLILAFCLVGCGPATKETTESSNDLDFENKLIQSQDFMTKSSMYGKFYYNSQDFILLLNQSSGQEWQAKLQEGLNFYYPQVFSLTEDFEVSDMGQYYLLDTGSEYEVRIVEKEDKLVAVGSKSNIQGIWDDYFR